MFNKRLSGALHIKERKRNQDKSKIATNGRAKIMTTKSTLEALRAQEDAKKAEADEKARKKAARELKRDINGEIERKWVQEGEEHARRVAAWTALCSNLKATGVRPKDLPKKPTKRKKQDIVDEVKAAAASHNDEIDDDEADEVESDHD